MSLNNFNPLVSIIIPVYNGSNYMREAIDSALAQTYKNIEIIVVNDGSKDNTEEIALSYGDKIRYFSKENGGVSTALNLAIKEAKGEYISWLSHDDVYLPNKIERQIEELSKLEDNTTILLSDIELIDEKSEVFSNRVLRDLYPLHKLQISKFLLLNGLIHGCTLLIKRDIFFEFGLFDPELRTVQDYWLWYDMFGKYKTYYIPEILIQSREHREQGHITLTEYIKNDQKILWQKMVLSLTIKEVAELLEVSVEKISKAKNLENIQLYYAPYKILRKIRKLNKKKPFSNVTLSWVYQGLPQYKKTKIKDFYKKLKSIIRAHQLLGKLKSENKENTILMFEPNTYHGETFAGYINYFTKMGFSIHFIADRKLEKENPFVLLNNANLKVFYTKLSTDFIKTFFKSKVLSKYKRIFVTSNLGYFNNVPIIISKNIPQNLKKKTLFIEHDTKNFIKAGEESEIKQGQIFSLIPREFKQYKIPMINPCYFGNIEQKKENNNIINFTVIGCINKGYKGHYLLSEAIEKCIENNITNFKITIIGNGYLEDFPNRISKFIDIKGRLNFKDMFAELEKTDYLLFLLDPNNKEHFRYLNENVSGTLQLALGFNILPVIDKLFASVYQLSEDNAIIYDKNLSNGIIEAISNYSKGHNAELAKNLSNLKNLYEKQSLETIEHALQ